MNICLKKIAISRCAVGVYLRWWFNGWHYYNFSNDYNIAMKTTNMGIQVMNYFSVISKIERSTRIKSEYSYRIQTEGIRAEDIAGFTGLLLAERVEQYELSLWREVDITRASTLIRDAGTNGYELELEITRKELPDSSSVYQKSLRLYIGDVLTDMDDDEIVPINKQVNNIAELQDRQSDFTSEFKIRKTRRMRALFELSGEVGASTTFPFVRQTCKLISDNIEIIPGGLLVLNKVDDSYYYVTIISGNVNFFNLIEGKKISDLLLPSTNHTWDVATMAATHSTGTPDIDIVYPLCEPSDDASIAPLTDDGTKVEMYGGWIWCFVRIKAIWDEIFATAGFTVTGGDILTSDKFEKLFMPIASREITNVDKYLYSMYWNGAQYLGSDARLGTPTFNGIHIIKGDFNFNAGYYIAAYDGTYKFTVWEASGDLFTPNPSIAVFNNAVFQGYMTFVSVELFMRTWEYELSGVSAGDSIQVWCSGSRDYFYWFLGVTEITGATISYGSVVEPHLYLPDMSQKDFIKMVCNLFALVPDVTARDRKIRFWNYDELYDNMLIARDWSNYLSERDDEVEFKFGDYAQNNYLKFKQSNDVIVDNGKGNLPFDDETLDEEKDIVQLVLSTCDEVNILPTTFAVRVARIAFNKWNDQDSLYDSNTNIDPRVVYIDYCREDASPLYQKSFWIRPAELPLQPGTFVAPSLEIVTPKIASSLPVAFSNMVFYYASLSRLLTKPNIRRAKFNLPVYEVAGLKHNIPVYLSQYKAYFYVNKISNFVPGQLCTIELIRL